MQKHYFFNNTNEKEILEKIEELDMCRDQIYLFGESFVYQNIEPQKQDEVYYKVVSLMCVNSKFWENHKENCKAYRFESENYENYGETLLIKKHNSPLKDSEYDEMFKTCEYRNINIVVTKDIKNIVVVKKIRDKFAEIKSDTKKLIMFDDFGAAVTDSKKTERVFSNMVEYYVEPKRNAENFDYAIQILRFYDREIKKKFVVKDDRTEFYGFDFDFCEKYMSMVDKKTLEYYGFVFPKDKNSFLCLPNGIY